MRAGRLIWILCAACTVIGCRNRDLLENELRARDIQYRETLDELKKAELHNEALQREVYSLRRGSKISPEQALHTYGLQRVTLGRATGGFDDDDTPGDEALHIVLEPRDAEDDIIKSPGMLHVTALEVSPQGIKTVLGSWDVIADDLRQHWKQGLFSTGYVLVLPWKSWPQYENLRVIARLTMPDGRVFEADRDVKIRLIPDLPEPTPETPPPVIETPEVLPQPTPVPDDEDASTSRYPPAAKATIELGPPEPLQPPDTSDIAPVLYHPFRPETLLTAPQFFQE